MAEKRMIAKKVIDSDLFLGMPLSAQALYFHLNARADDDGFVNNPKKITKMVSAAEDDLRILLMKRFIIGFDSGVIVITHWRVHNTLRADRYNPTDYQDEFARLGITKTKEYTEDPEKASHPQLPPPPQPQLTTPDVRVDHPESGQPEIRPSRSKCSKIFSDFAGEDSELQQSLEDFDKMRKEIGKPMTDRARSMLLTKLQSFPKSEWVPILNQSIFHTWQGIYPLSDDSRKASPRKESKGSTASNALQNLHAQYEDEL